MAFRRHLAGLGLGIAEAMDTAQRGMGLDWPGALELIRRTRSELPDALVFNGAGTDHLDAADARSLDDVRRAYFEQVEAIQKVGGRIILMASRALAKVAKGPTDYVAVYRDVLARCDDKVILHWLGDMFDPALAGYWGADTFDDAMETALAVIGESRDKVDGIKISLLDKDKEILMRRRLPDGVKMYTGDDFNYPELIEGDEKGFSHALLGIFDPLAPAAAYALSRLGAGDAAAFRATLDPTVPLARLIFRAPTRYYKTGVVFTGLAERVSGPFRHAQRRPGDAAAAPFRRDIQTRRRQRPVARPRSGDRAHAQAARRLRRLTPCAISPGIIRPLRSTPPRSATMSRGTAPAGRRNGSSTPVPSAVSARSPTGGARSGRGPSRSASAPAAAGLAVSGLCRSPFLVGPLAPPTRQAVLDDFHASIDMAAGLQAACLTICVGGVVEGTHSMVESLKQVADIVAEAAPYARQVGREAGAGTAASGLWRQSFLPRHRARRGRSLRDDRRIRRSRSPSTSITSGGI